MKKCDKNNAYKLDPSDYEYEDYLDELRSCWQDRYDPDFKSNIDVDDYDCEKEYRNALIENLHDKYDPDNMHSEIDSCDYSCVDEYHDALMKVQSTSY